MIKILAMCTGNICRSPMAAGLLRVGVGVVGLDAKIASAGQIPSGRRAEPHAVAAMADKGIDISGHRSHQLSDVDIDAADLILAMAGEHVLDVAGRVPGALWKTYTIKEFVRRAQALGPRRDMTLEQYLRRLDQPGRHARLLRRHTDDDVADPLGQGRKAFAKTASELDALVWTAVDLLAGYEPSNRSI